MANAIEWIFKLYDRASAPARQITKSYDILTRSTKMLETATTRTERTVSRAWQSLQQSAQNVGRGIQGAFQGVGQAIRRVINLPTILAAGFASWGGKLIVDALGWRESTLAGLDLLLGGQQEAVAVMGEIEKLSTGLALPMNVIADQMEAFLRTGKATVGETEVMLRALGELYAVRGFKPEAFEEGARALRMMLGATALTPYAVRGLRQAGISTGIFMEQLAKLRGETVQQTTKALAAGAVAGRQGAQAMVNTIQQQFSRGAPIGTALEQQMRTLPGIFARLRTATSNFFKRMDIGAMPGLEPFRRFITSIIRILEDPALLKGAQDVISELFQTIFGPLERFTTPEKIMAFMQDLPRRARGVVRAIKEFGAGVHEGFRLLEGAWTVVAPIFRAIGTLFGRAEAEAGQSGAKLAGTITTLVGALALLGPVVGPLVGPFVSLAGALGPVGIGAAAAAAGLKVAYDNIPEFRQAVDATAQAVRDFDRWIEPMNQALRDFEGWIGRGIGQAWTALTAQDNAINTALRSWERAFNQWAEGIIKWALDFGGNLVGALGKGITDAAGAVGSAISGVWNRLTGQTEKAAQIQSPSKVFMGYGRDIMAGLAQGIDRGAADVMRAAAALLPAAPPVPAAAALLPPSPLTPTAAAGASAAAISAPAPTSRAAPSATISLVFNIDGSTSPIETGRAVERSVTSTLASLFETLAWESGGIGLAPEGT